MTKTHKIIIGVVALTLISLTAVFALNNTNGKGTLADNGGCPLVKSDCGSCPSHMASHLAKADACPVKDTCPMVASCPKVDSCPMDTCGTNCENGCGCCDGCKGGTCDCEDCKCADCCKKATGCCCDGDCQCCDGCKGGNCTCEDCQCCACCCTK